MGFAGRAEVCLDAEVHLHRSILEPTAAACGEVLGLGDVAEPEDPFVERDRAGLLADRHRELHMIDRLHRHGSESVSCGPVNGRRAS